MGLDVSHGCWSGAYSAFGRWRRKLTEVAGYGDINDYEGFGGNKPWPSKADDVLIELLDHSDCDGLLPAEICMLLANRLEDLLPALTVAGFGGGHIGDFAEKTQQFIEGLRLAAANDEDVEFW